MDSSAAKQKFLAIKTCHVAGGTRAASSPVSQVKQYQCGPGREGICGVHGDVDGKMNKPYITPIFDDAKLEQISIYIPYMFHRFIGDL